jgi:hypothetical protein
MGSDVVLKEFFIGLIFCIGELVEPWSLGVAPVLGEVIAGVEFVVDDGMLVDAGANDAIIFFDKDFDQRVDSRLRNKPNGGGGRGLHFGFRIGEGGIDRGVASVLR